MNVPDDLKVCYKTNVQMQRTFRDDKDTVAIAKRTVELIERIAELEAKLAACEWRPITETDLPKVGDEIMEFNMKGTPAVTVVTNDWPYMYVSYVQSPCFKRPINPPQQGKP